jgi:hypothetical protein
VVIDGVEAFAAWVMSRPAAHKGPGPCRGMPARAR